jgi:hypothetical protein
VRLALQVVVILRWAGKERSPPPDLLHYRDVPGFRLKRVTPSFDPKITEIGIISRIHFFHLIEKFLLVIE